MPGYHYRAELVWPGACAARWAVNLCHGLTHLEVSGHEGGLTILNYLLQSKKQAASPCWGYAPNTGVISALLAGVFYITQVSIKTVTPGVNIFLATSTT